MLIASGGAIEKSSSTNDLSAQCRFTGPVDARNVMLTAGVLARPDVIHARIAIEADANSNCQ
jgi:hypothetical protein